MAVIKLLNGPLAQYHRATGLLVVESPAEAILSALQASSRDEYTQELVLTYWHEWVHFIQSISCTHIRIEGLQKIQTAGALLLSGDKQYKIDSALRLAMLKRRFEHRAFGVSIHDLCEGVAVLESFRICTVEPNVEAFLSWREEKFPGKGNSPYRRTFDILSHETNADIAFDLLPVLSFLALQGDVPGASFNTLLSNNLVRNGQFVGLSAEQIVTGLGYEALFDQFSRISVLHPSQQHKTLHPILVKIFNRFTSDNALNIFARPHLVRDQLKDPGGIDECLFVPLIVGAFRLGSGSMVAFGAARENKMLRSGIVHLTAIISAAETILSSRTNYVPCPHQICPNHASKLCSGYFTLPDSPEICGFRNEIKSLTGKEIHTVMDEIGELSIEALVARVEKLTETVDIFPEIKFDQGAERDSYAERFDERYMLDAEDNDPVTLIFCSTPGCKTMLNIRASHRQARCGYVICCPNCGKEYRINKTSGPTFFFRRNDEE